MTSSLECGVEAQTDRYASPSESTKVGLHMLPCGPRQSFSIFAAEPVGTMQVPSIAPVIIMNYYRPGSLLVTL